MNTRDRAGENPLLENNAPYGAPAFDRIRVEHFEPAIERAIERAREEVNRVANAPGVATFENTIEALEKSGEMLERVASIFFNLNAAATSDEMQEVARRVAPALAAFQHEVHANRALFARVKQARENVTGEMSPEQRALLERTWRAFIEGGANIEGPGRERFKEIVIELSRLSLDFERMVLADTNAFALHVTDEARLSGLPDGARDAAAAAAAGRGLDGWLFTLHEPVYVPFMKYADDRAAREEMYRARSSRGMKGDENDTREVIRKITATRLEKARLLGHDNHAARVLVDRMAGSPATVNRFIDELLTPAREAAERELREVAASAGGDLQAWDWSYHANKLKRQRFAIDDEMTRPYFQLERVQAGIFDLARRLYGVTFRPVDVPLYHEETRCFEALDGDDFLALLYLDYFPRENKGGGAWMTCFREQAGATRPLVSIVMNLPRPAGGKPSLLSFDEVTTFLHEFGHALHAMLSRCAYASTSGTNVYRDFVELPSQVMENWALEKEWLDTWAAHHETGEKIPGELVEKIRLSSRFASGYACCRQLGLAMIDMAWHSITTPVTGPVEDFERRAAARAALLPPVEGTSVSPAFTHVFSGGYAAGYYGYKWAEVLDADAFSLFKRDGIFNPATAAAFREHVLEKGGSEHPMTLYKRFRGAEPSITPLLEREGWQ
ncbi:MAG: M3 family metallopeptidase [Odoribacteraceae bacterium]|jgi:peptidyl-dipeptidase Dcp|nr:M3 family metallopeptidase [Odoribacteraceae bacterium]